MKTIANRGRAHVFRALLAIIVAAAALAGCARNLNYSEYSPTVSADGRMIVYQTDRVGESKYKLYTKFRTLLGWTPPIHLIFANSRIDDDGGPFITYDQNYLLLSSDKPGGQGDVDLWISRRKGGVWSAPENLGRPVNSAGYDGFASLSPDGSTLYFVRECPDKKGGSGDIFCIYVSVKNDRGAWTEPGRLPAPVNSEYSDFGPVILADGRSLIFSSNRPGGLGGYDLYKTEMMDGGRWSDPVNLGPAINSPHDEMLASVPASGDVIYYSKPDGRGRYRIAKAPVPASLRQSAVVSVAGIVSDRADPGKKLHAEIVVTDMTTGEARTIASNEADGSYFIILNRDRRYDVSVRSKGYVFYSTSFDLASRGSREKYVELIRDIELAPIEAGRAFSLNNVHFEFKSSVLHPDSRYELDRVAAMLARNPGMAVEIGGHTDSVGPESYNHRLSFERAESVASYLASRGIDRKRMTAQGYGTTRPLARGNDEKSRAMNRRVEITILSHGSDVSFHPGAARK